MPRKRKSATPAASSRTAGAAKPPRPESKKAQLIASLQTSTGTDIAALSDTLGWQRHTTRAALTGLRKAGYIIERLGPTDGEPARYRITGGPA